MIVDNENIGRWIDELAGEIEILKKKINAISGGDTVTITPARESGTKVADYSIGETTGSLYAPTPFVPKDYSTTEQDSGIKWLNGETIYQKTVNFGALPNSASKDVAHGISDIAEVIDVRPKVQSASGDYITTPYGYPNIDGKIITSLYVSDTNVNITTNTDLSSCVAYVTIFYTKTPPVETKKRRK